MSRLSRNPVVVPKNIKWDIKGRTFSVYGQKGVMTLSIPVEIILDSTDDGIMVQCSGIGSSQAASRLCGTYFRLIHNMFHGVSKGFEKKLKLVGVGYRMEIKGKDLKMSLGYSHEVSYPIPSDITMELEAPKKQGDIPVTFLSVRGENKQRVGQVVAELQSYRPPEPYKGKGFHIEGEFVYRKEAKK